MQAAILQVLLLLLPQLRAFNFEVILTQPKDSPKTLRYTTTTSLHQTSLDTNKLSICARLNFTLASDSSSQPTQLTKSLNCYAWEAFHSSKFVTLDDVFEGSYSLYVWLESYPGNELVGEVKREDFTIEVPNSTPKPHSSTCAKTKTKTKRKRAILSLTIASPSLPHLSRPWVPLSLSRMQSYALRTNSTLLHLTHSPQCSHLLNLPRNLLRAEMAMDFRDCAMLSKIAALRDALDEYERVLLVDDTVLIRGDARDLFEIVAVENIGATVQTDAMFGKEENERQVREMCGYYNVSSGAGLTPSSRVFNSGILLLSDVHMSLFDGIDAPSFSTRQEVSERAL